MVRSTEEQTDKLLVALGSVVIQRSEAHRVRIRVTLQLTVSQSVRLGVEPNLGLLTRDIFFF
jgi:hypothetical protein